ncbi:hypothetical protein Hte_004939 [Hypoxylon texense]
MSSSFTLFPSLPPELRQTIWREALENERYRYILVYQAPSGMVLQPKSTSPFLVLCRESRALALTFYSTAFDVISEGTASILDGRWVIKVHRGSLRVNLDSDVFVWFFGPPPSDWSDADLKDEFNGWFDREDLEEMMMLRDKEQFMSSVRRTLYVNLGEHLPPDTVLLGGVDEEWLPTNTIFCGFVAPNKDDCLTQEGHLLSPRRFLQHLMDKMRSNSASVNYRYGYRDDSWPDCVAGLPTF